MQELILINEDDAHAYDQGVDPGGVLGVYGPLPLGLLTLLLERLDIAYVHAPNQRACPLVHE